MKVVAVFFSLLLTPDDDFNEDAVKCFSFPIPGTTSKIKKHVSLKKMLRPGGESIMIGFHKKLGPPCLQRHRINPFG